MTYIICPFCNTGRVVQNGNKEELTCPECGKLKIVRDNMNA